MKKLITGVAVVFGLIFPSTFTIAAPPDDTFVVGLPTDTIGLEPAQISSRHTANIMKHIFGQLYSVSETGSIDRNLAESYKAWRIYVEDMKKKRKKEKDEENMAALFGGRSDQKCISYTFGITPPCKPKCSQ